MKKKVFFYKSFVKLKIFFSGIFDLEGFHDFCSEDPELKQNDKNFSKSISILGEILEVFLKFFRQIFLFGLSRAKHPVRGEDGAST